MHCRNPNPGFPCLFFKASFLQDRPSWAFPPTSRNLTSTNPWPLYTRFPRVISLSLFFDHFFFQGDYLKSTLCAGFFSTPFLSPHLPFFLAVRSGFTILTWHLVHVQFSSLSCPSCPTILLLWWRLINHSVARVSRFLFKDFFRTIFIFCFFFLFLEDVFSDNLLPHFFLGRFLFFRTKCPKVGSFPALHDTKQTFKIGFGAFCVFAFFQFFRTPLALARIFVFPPI